MKNVVITGRGLITPLGNGLVINEESLRNGRSGVIFVPEWKEIGLESQVAGLADPEPRCPLLNQKNMRFMTPNTKMAVAAAWEALNEAKLSLDEIRGKRIAVILGCASSAYQQIYDGAKLVAETRKVKKLSPFTVPRVMASSAVSNLSLNLGLTGESYDISSACTSSAHAIMIAARLLEAGVYDMVITGGAEETSWVHALGFDAMRAMSRGYNDRPTSASRPFDRGRDGFVMASGAGILIMETVKHAAARGVKPIVRLSGISANSNATDMVVPDPESSCSVMKMAIEDAGLDVGDINYINTHGTSTPTGDPLEMSSIKLLLGDYAGKVAINSTKSMTGHMIGATGAVEAIFCTMMMEKNFICPSINLENPEPEFAWADLVRECRTNINVRHSLSNSFGFGGTNASLVFSKLD
jgi:3-oxoacyl-[acyl-carrier-protein] synthase-1